MELLVSVARGVVPERFKPLAKSLRHAVLPLRYRGEGVVCPCCNGRFRAFRPAGAVSPREGAMCPGCGARERHRLLWLYLEERTPLLREQLRLLHVGPEPVLQQRFRTLPNVDCVSIDLHSPLADLLMDVSNLLFDDAYFDAVVCVHVLEHVEDDRRAMQELHRVLRPGGWAVVISPIKRETTLEDRSVGSPQEREQVYGQRDRVRLYGPDLKDRLVAAGFDVDVVRFAAELGPAAVARHGLLESEDVYVSRKRAAPDSQSMLDALDERVADSRPKSART